MTCKFSKSILSRFLLGAYTLLLTSTITDAQQPSPATSPRPTTGYVRFWNMLSGKAAPILDLLSAEDKPLTTATPSSVGSSYISLPPGTYTFIVRKTGDANSVLKKQPVVLRGDTYITFLVSEKNGQPTVDLIDDTLDPKKSDDPARLVIRQFMPAAQVTVSTREGIASPLINFGTSATLETLPHRLLYLTMKATGLGPDTKTWNTDVDFTSARHATLLIVGDSYGRFRPRIAYDGQAGSAPEATPPPSSKP